jgi:uncharacterized iron-regulated membrane protein
MRQILYRIHLWLGVGIGLYFVILGLTGTLLVFGRELDRRLSADSPKVTPLGRRQPASAIVASFEKTHPGAHATAVTYPKEPDDAFLIKIGPTRPAQIQVYLDPHTADVIGERRLGSSVYGFLVNLHYNLYLGPPGRRLNGWGALLLLIVLTSGVWLWWPAGRVSRERWRGRFLVRRDAGTLRLLDDVHNSVGMYSLAFLLIFTLTALEFAFPNQVRPLLRTLGASGAAAHASGGGLALHHAESGAPLGLDQLIVIADRSADGRLSSLELPEDPSRPLIVTKALAQYDRTRARVEIAVDRYTGNVQSIHDSRHEPLGDALVRWCVPLHYGIWGGFATKLVYVVLGLVPAASFLTGFWRWRLRAARTRRYAIRQEPQTGTVPSQL